jgi:hypothetical protein
LLKFKGRDQIKNCANLLVSHSRQRRRTHDQSRAEERGKRQAEQYNQIEESTTSLGTGAMEV